MIALGGAGGAAARYAISRAEPVRAGTFPFTTFAINISGALVLAVLLESLARHRIDTWWLRPFAAIGVLGGFTTFSTMCVEAMLLGRDGHVVLAALYLAGERRPRASPSSSRACASPGCPRRVVPPDEGES